MEFEFSPEQIALMDSVRSFVDEQVEPRMEDIEKTNEMPDDVLNGASELGLFGISIPEEYGGSALDRFSRMLVHQMVGRSGLHKYTNQDQWQRRRVITRERD